MANLFLRRGPLANLRAEENGQYKVPLIDGAISFTTDEPAIYLDVTDSNGAVTRKRVGDLVCVDNLSDIVLNPETMTGIVTDANGLVSEWSTSALYYVKTGDALLKCNKDGETYKWIQLNATSDIEKDISDLLEDIEGINSTLEGVNTQLDNITKPDGLIATAKQEAIDAAATDATTKANKAKEDAIADAEGKIATLTTTVNGKVDKSTYDTDKEATDKAIDAVEQSVTNLTNGAVKDLQDAVDNLDQRITDEVSRATGAEEALGKRIDGVNTTIEDIQTSVSNAATKDELATAKSDLEAYADQAETDAISSANGYTDGEIAKVNAEVAKKADKTTTETAIENIIKADTGLIAVAKKEAIETAAADATTKANNAETTAKGYTDGKVTELNTAIAGKVDKSAYDTKVAELEGAIAKAKTDAADDATAKANAAQAAAEATAASALSGVKTELEGKINQKVSTETFNTTVGTLETKTDAEAKLAAAKAYTDSALAAADAMKFMGVVGGEGNINTLPTTDVKGGDTYKVGAVIPYADGKVAYVGDLLIAERDQRDEAVYAGEWFHVSSGYEDDYSERFVADDTSATVTLKNTVDQAHGAVQFKAAENSNVEISMTSTFDDKTKSHSSVVTVGMVWGEF